MSAIAELVTPGVELLVSELEWLLSEQVKHPGWDSDALLGKVERRLRELGAGVCDMDVRVSVWAEVRTDVEGLQSAGRLTEGEVEELRSIVTGEE